MTHPPQGGEGIGSGRPQPRSPRSGLVAVVTGAVVTGAVVTGGVVAVVALAVLAFLALGSTVLSTSAVQHDVSAQFEQQEGVALDLACPRAMRVARGAIYTCRGTTADGEDVTLRITITDEHTAAYSWRES